MKSNLTIALFAFAALPFAVACTGNTDDAADSDTTDDAIIAKHEVTKTGTLESVVGVGGETTGRALFAADGHYELVLSDSLAAQFQSGKKARVTGTMTTLHGVETGDRPAVEVSDILVCPTTSRFDCKPGPNVRLTSVCAAANRTWISANCDGVSFRD